MVLFESKNIVLLGSAAVAVLAGAYVLWGPSEKKKSRRTTCPGLVNLGNTCFLNAVLQAMAPCYSMVLWLSDFTAKKLDYERRLATTILKVLRVLNNDSVEFTEEYSPSDVIDALHARRWVIPSAEEQDAYEMFQVLTQTLDEEASHHPKVVPLFNVTDLQQEASGEQSGAAAGLKLSRSGCGLPSLPRTDTNSPFRGLLASQLQCKRCGNKCPVKYDSFDSLSLAIPASYVGPVTVDGLLKHFIMSETVQDVECEGCAKRQGTNARTSSTTDAPKATFLKKMTIGKMPQCLCLHIKRTVWLNNGMPMKRREHVSFSEILNMGQYVYHQKPRKPTTLPLIARDNDLGARLVGGRTKVNGYAKVGSIRSPGASSPTLSVPYSGPVNLLKALNYHSRNSMDGLSLGPPHVDQNTISVQRLVQAYSMDAPPSHGGGSGGHVYKLTAVIVHLGDVFSGHFLTYRRTTSSNGQRFPSHWLYTSDSLVKKASTAEVMKSSAYMLFYERI